jgi:hypothetical protein
MSGHRVSSGSNPSYNLSRSFIFRPVHLQPPPSCPSAPRRCSPEHHRTAAHRRFPPCLRHRPAPAASPLSRATRFLHSARAAAALCAATAAPRRLRHHHREALLRLPETILDLRPSRVAPTLGFAPPCRVRSSSNRPSRDVFAPRARPVRREVSRPRSPFSRRSEVAFEFHFMSYLICLLPLGFCTFRSYMLLIVDPSIPSFQRVCRCVGVTAVLLIGSEAKPTDTD